MWREKWKRLCMTESKEVILDLECLKEEQITEDVFFERWK